MPSPTGLTFDNGCRITHGQGCNIKQPFPDMMPNLTMYELTPSNKVGFKGQLGFIEFDTSIRLPRHIHMTESKDRFLDERIMVLHGTGIVEIAGAYWVIAPGSLVDAVGGVPHTWSACPAGVKLPDGTVSDGRFTMVYEYEEETSFFPTRQTEVFKTPGEYEAYEGDLDSIRFPAMRKEDVVQNAKIVFDREIQKVTLA